MCQQQICPNNAIDVLHMPISSCVHMRQLCQHIYLISAPCNQQCHNKHYLHINDIYLWPNMPARFYIYFTLHINSTLLHIQEKQASQYVVTLAVICICTMHLATIFILYHLWPLFYPLFSSHILISVSMPITIENTQMSIMPMKYWQPQLFYIW